MCYIVIVFINKFPVPKTHALSSTKGHISSGEKQIKKK